MTDAQWLFEYHALRKKEEAEIEVAAKTMETNANILRDTIVATLGLGLFVPKGTPEPAPGIAPFIPAALLFSNHHLLKPVFEDWQKANDADKAMGDDAFEEFSKRLARGDVGDMDPLLFGNLPGGLNITQLVAQGAMKQALATLGVKPRPLDAPAVPHFGKRPMKKGVRVAIESEERILQEQADAIPRPIDRVGPAPVPAREGARVRVQLEPGVFAGEDGDG